MAGGQNLNILKNIFGQSTINNYPLKFHSPQYNLALEIACAFVKHRTYLYRLKQGYYYNKAGEFRKKEYLIDKNFRIESVATLKKIIEEYLLLQPCYKIFFTRIAILFNNGNIPKDIRDFIFSKYKVLIKPENQMAMSDFSDYIINELQL